MVRYAYLSLGQEVPAVTCAPLTEEPAMAEAVFGSIARGDSDQISDRDILVVDADVAKLRNRTRRLTDQGWSVAPYTFRKLEVLAENGALFVQHLKLEARIIWDDERRLRNLLDGFQPRLSYARELAANARLADLAREVPDVPLGPLYAADVLYVALRNFGVLTLAEQGIHRYAYAEILDGLKQIGALEPGAIDHLLKLRTLKSAYRNSAHLDIGNALDLVRTIVKHLPTSGFPATIALARAAEVIKTDCGAELRAPYLELRDLEKRYIALAGGHTLTHDDETLELLKRWIRNPRMYASWSAKNAPTIRTRIRAISSAHSRRMDAFAA